MLNMNSPVVQNLIQPQSGFNPYMNNGYIPQPQQINYNNTYQQQNYYGYNPYFVNKTNKDALDEWEYSYDPMPKVIVNERRGINTSPVQAYGGPVIQSAPYINNGYNSMAFNGYMNPVLMRNQMEAQKLQQREEAIQQGKIWRALLKNEKLYDEDFDIDAAVSHIESLYYSEPVTENIPIKDRMIIEKNNHFGMLESRLDYYRENNIPIPDNRNALRMQVYNYYNNINSIIGNPDNCDMVDYFRRVYPELKFQQLSWEADKFNKNLKNSYNSKEFNKLVDNVSADRSDSYYYKLMESFAEDGVKLTNNDGLVITPDEMEIKLPDRLLKNRQDRYYEQRKKFYDSIFTKEG